MKCADVCLVAKNSLIIGWLEASDGRVTMSKDKETNPLIHNPATPVTWLRHRIFMHVFRIYRVPVVHHNNHHGVQLLERQSSCWVAGKYNKRYSTQTLLYLPSSYFILSKWSLQFLIIFKMFRSSSPAGFLVQCGMLADRWRAEAEGAWWSTNPCSRSMRSSCVCPSSLGSMAAAGNATSVHMTTAPRWETRLLQMSQDVLLWTNDRCICTFSCHTNQWNVWELDCPDLSMHLLATCLDLLLRTTLVLNQSNTLLKVTLFKNKMENKL